MRQILEVKDSKWLCERHKIHLWIGNVGLPSGQENTFGTRRVKSTTASYETKNLPSCPHVQAHGGQTARPGLGSWSCYHLWHASWCGGLWCPAPVAKINRVWVGSYVNVQILSVSMGYDLKLFYLPIDPANDQQAQQRIRHKSHHGRSFFCIFVENVLILLIGKMGVPLPCAAPTSGFDPGVRTHADTSSPLWYTSIMTICLLMRLLSKG